MLMNNKFHTRSRACLTLCKRNSWSSNESTFFKLQISSWAHIVKEFWVYDPTFFNLQTRPLTHTYFNNHPYMKQPQSKHNHPCPLYQDSFENGLLSQSYDASLISYHLLHHFSNLISSRLNHCALLRIERLSSKRILHA